MAHKRKRRAAASLHVMQPDASGADIGAEEIFVAVRPNRDDEPVRISDHPAGPSEHP